MATRTPKAAITTTKGTTMVTTLTIEANTTMVEPEEVDTGMAGETTNMEDMRDVGGGGHTFPVIDTTTTVTMKVRCIVPLEPRGLQTGHCPQSMTTTFKCPSPTYATRSCSLRTTDREVMLNRAPGRLKAARITMDPESTWKSRCTTPLREDIVAATAAVAVRAASHLDCIYVDLDTTNLF